MDFTHSSDNERRHILTETILIFLEVSHQKDSAASQELEKIREIAREHGRDCALGSVPACTCFAKEAQNFLAIVGASNLLRLARSAHRGA